MRKFNATLLIIFQIIPVIYILSLTQNCETYSSALSFKIWYILTETTLLLYNCWKFISHTPYYVVSSVTTRVKITCAVFFNLDEFCFGKAWYYIQTWTVRRSIPELCSNARVPKRSPFWSKYAKSASFGVYNHALQWALKFSRTSFWTQWYCSAEYRHYCIS